MYRPAESVILPQHVQERGRIFVVESFDRKRYCHLAGRIMDIYAEVTGKTYSEFDRRDYPEYIVDQLTAVSYFELRLGMPKLAEPARTHGKLRGSVVRLVLPDETSPAAGFWVDTNDSDSLHPRPDPSQALVDEFAHAISELADSEFGETNVPAPLQTVNFTYYNPMMSG